VNGLIQTLTAFGHFSAIDLSGLARVTSLLVLPFAHEDLAIIFGGYIVVNKLMPVGLVALSIYGGMVASDFALYGIGAAARYLPWLRRFAVDERVRRFGETLKRNVFGLVALCRVVPGVVFVAFVACGWTRVSLVRFIAASLLISALYLPLMLYLVIVFGDALYDRLGLVAWPMLLVAISASNFVRKRVFAFREAAKPSAAGEIAAPADCFGMPPLALADRKVARAERIPPLLFYAPLAANWVRLGLRYGSLTLPTAANPQIFTGGMWGESKSAYFFDLDPAMRQWIADFVVIKRNGDRLGPAGDIDRAVRGACRGRPRFPAGRQTRYRLARLRRLPHRRPRTA
jgi:membrane protein DedA with SNARE-associated domain